MTVQIAEELGLMVSRKIFWLLLGQAEYATDKISAYASIALSNTWMKRVELMRNLSPMESELKTFFAYTVKG